ncbi:unnamed protein product [Toxocara canis]|uniref:WD_REPEATS_REGION domain-containing protein n=1 Tax=Toxocara canis TaxID=6265 RepID=A0A183UL41_TOXCA|nr:unnamed protein product [Toxocara canis]
MERSAHVAVGNSQIVAWCTTPHFVASAGSNGLKITNQKTVRHVLLRRQPVMSRGHLTTVMLAPTIFDLKCPF